MNYDAIQGECSIFVFRYVECSSAQQQRCTVCSNAGRMLCCTVTQLKDAVPVWMTAATLPIKQLELVLVELQRRIDREGNAVVEWTATDETAFAAKTLD